MARKKWSKLSKAEKKAFRDGDRSVGKKEYKTQRQAKRPVAVNKAASQKVKNVATKLTAAQAAGKDKQSKKLANKLQDARGNQLRKSDIRNMVRENNGNIQAVSNQLKQNNLRSGAQQFLANKLSQKPTPKTKQVEVRQPQTPAVQISGGVNEVNNSNNIKIGTSAIPNEPPARPDTTAPNIGNQLSYESNQSVGYRGINTISNSTVSGGVGNVNNSNNSLINQGSTTSNQRSQAFELPNSQIPKTEMNNGATPTSNVMDVNKTQTVDYSGQNKISDSFIGGGVGNVNNADYSVTIQGGGNGLSNFGAAAAADALNENQYERSKSKLSGSDIANKYIANAYAASGIMDTINNAQNRSNQAQAYMGARAKQQRDMVMGNYIKPAVWQQPEPLKAVESKTDEMAKRYDFS